MRQMRVVLMFAVLLPWAAHADLLTWTVDEGSHAVTGSFDFDSVTQTFSSVSLTTPHADYGTPVIQSNFMAGFLNPDQTHGLLLGFLTPLDPAAGTALFYGGEFHDPAGLPLPPADVLDDLFGGPLGGLLPPIMATPMPCLCDGDGPILPVLALPLIGEVFGSVTVAAAPPTAVPEPAPLALTGLGLGLLALGRRRQRQQRRG